MNSGLDCIGHDHLSKWAEVPRGDSGAHDDLGHAYTYVLIVVALFFRINLQGS